MQVNTMSSFTRCLSRSSAVLERDIGIRGIICLSVRLSVRPSHAGIDSKRMTVGSCSFHQRAVQRLCFFWHQLSCQISSVGRISEWGVKIEAPRGVGCGEGVSPSPLGEGAVPPRQKKILNFFASKSHVFDALWHPFEVILLLVENEQQCTKWFILQCYRQPNIAHGSRSRRILPC